MEKVKKCDLCGANANRLFLRAEDRNYQTGEYIYLQCKKCNLVWLSPRPTQQTLAKFYPSIYKAHLTLQKTSNLKNKVRGLIYKYHILSRLFIKDQLFYWPDKGRILDVGAGNGKYLEILRSWGWDSYGLELSKSTVKMAKRNSIKNIKQGTLLKSKYSNSYFDAIRFSHVMEHVPSPSKELAKTYKLLKKGGKVIILIPNIKSIFFYVFKSFWYPLDPPRHFYHFTPVLITKYLKQAGFKNVQIKYNQSPYTLIRSIQYLRQKKIVEQRYGLIVYPLALAMKAIDFLKLSDVIEVVADKK